MRTHAAACGQVTRHPWPDSLRSGRRAVYGPLPPLVCCVVTCSMMSNALSLSLAEGRTWACRSAVMTACPAPDKTQRSSPLGPPGDPLTAHWHCLPQASALPDARATAQLLGFPARQSQSLSAYTAHFHGLPQLDLRRWLPHLHLPPHPTPPPAPPTHASHTRFPSSSSLSHMATLPSKHTAQQRGTCFHSTQGGEAGGGSCIGRSLGRPGPRPCRPWR